jgi:hypothetical protein
VAFAEQHRRALATALTLGDSAGPIRGRGRGRCRPGWWPPGPGEGCRADRQLISGPGRAATTDRPRFGTGALQLLLVEVLVPLAMLIGQVAQALPDGSPSRLCRREPRRACLQSTLAGSPVVVGKLKGEAVQRPPRARVASTSRCVLRPVGLGNSRMQQRGRGDDQDGAGLGFTSGSWRQLQAEVAVGDPARLSTSPSACGPSWSTARLLGCRDGRSRGAAYPAHTDASFVASGPG